MGHSTLQPGFLVFLIKTKLMTLRRQRALREAANGSRSRRRSCSMWKEGVAQKRQEISWSWKKKGIVCSAISAMRTVEVHVLPICYWRRCLGESWLSTVSLYFRFFSVLFVIKKASWHVYGWRKLKKTNESQTKSQRTSTKIVKKHRRRKDNNLSQRLITHL